MQNTIIKIDSPNEPDIYSKLINNLLLKVQKPGQYLGIEWGHLVGKSGEKELKNWDNTKATMSIIYPDLYELGMSNFGTKILYQIVNKHPDYLCDRSYAPMKDMEDLLKSEKISLWGWESFKPLNEFDILGFSLSYELNYTNVLNMLELSNLNLLASERKEIFPLIFAGGPSTFNPEPMAEFMDFYIIGDGEEIIIEILDAIKDFKTVLKEEKPIESSKDELLLRLSQIKGIYVPKFYTPDPNENDLPKPIIKEIKIKPLGSNIEQIFKVPEKIEKRVVSLSEQNQPTSGPVPYLASVQDRQVLEIRRGCDRGCRFCQPGYVYLPVRERTPKDLVKISQEALDNTGYDEYSLLSLSASDYTRLHELAITLKDTHSEKGISLSMPSQRADRFDIEIANELNAVRKSGITLAPEAGTERLRQVINKGLKEEEIRRAIENVYDSGFNHVKLYFMIGLPTETTEDLEGILDLLKWSSNLSKIKNKRPIDITCTISTFVPKSFTPFQWFSQNKSNEFQEKINHLKSRIKELKLRNVRLNCTDPKIALLEAVMSRGSRKISKLVLSAFKKGAKFDAWDESLNINAWIEASKELGISLQEEASKERIVGSPSPWDVIDSGLLNKFLITEWEKAVAVSETPACTENTCHACGVCFELGVLNEVTEDRSKNNKFVKVIEEKDKEIKVKPSPKMYQTQSVQKLEIIHTKTGDLRFISHLDLQKLLERALRRAKIPFAFTEGFNPRPKMKWLMPLPLFYESNHELMHLELSDYLKFDDLQIKSKINEQLPKELKIKSLSTINLTNKLENIENSKNIKVSYKVLTYEPTLWENYICELKSAIDNFLNQSSLIIKILKKNKDQQQSEKLLDIRPNVEEIKITNTSPLELELLLSGNVRAELVIEEIFKTAINEINKGKTQNILPETLSGWQNIWKIKKEEIIVGANVN